MRLWSLHCKYREPLSGKVWKEWKIFKKDLRLSCLSHPKTKKQRDCLCLMLVWKYGYACLKRPRLFLKIYCLNWILCFAPKVASLFILYYTGWECVMSTLAIYFWKRGIPLGPLTFFIKVSTWIQRFVLAWFGLLGFITKSVCTKSVCTKSVCTKSVCTIYVANMFNTILRAEIGRSNLTNDDN